MVPGRACFDHHDVMKKFHMAENNASVRQLPLRVPDRGRWEMRDDILHVQKKLWQNHKKFSLVSKEAERSGSCAKKTTGSVPGSTKKAQRSSIFLAPAACEVSTTSCGFRDFFAVL